MWYFSNVKSKECILKMTVTYLLLGEVFRCTRADGTAEIDSCGQESI